MPVLIDGNNLLHVARDFEDPERLLGRSLLCQRLGAWAERTGERVHVVFDGPAPPPALAEQIGHPALRVSFSGRGKSADATLMEVLETDSAARRVLLVSSDGEVARAGRRRRARTVSSAEFWKKLRQDLARPLPPPAEPREKREGQTSEQTEDWLREFDI